MLFLTRVVVLLAALRTWYFYVEGLECVGLKCENGGTVMVDSSGDSYCACPSDVTGLLCEYRIRESEFPTGPYAIPMSKDGCPEGPGYGWRTGNINITTRLPLYDPESFPEECREFVHSKQIQSNASFTTNILGPFDKYTLQMNFCFKLSVNRYVNKTSWPRGNYGVYGSDQGCPTDMSAKEFSIFLPPVLHYQIDGHVPLFDVIERKDGSEMKFLYCRHQDNVKDLQSDNFNSFYPFMVIKDPWSSKDGCPEPVGYVSKDERFPVPLPTSMRDFNTTISNTSVPNVYYLISYCHIIPSHFQQVDEHKNDGYTELFLRQDFPAFMYPFVDITTGEYRCNSIGPKLPGCDTADTWILVDIRRTVLVSAVVILSRKENLDVAVSDIFVSDQRWSFLYNGALLCRNKETETYIVGMRAFRCVKPQLGRYATLTVSPLGNEPGALDFLGTSVSVLMYNAAQVYETEKKYRHEEIEHLRNISLVSAEIASVIDHADIESKRCHQELGMQDFGILYEQLTASSWQPRNLPSQARPGYSGWCANTFDKYPYIQVDLVFKTLIDGIVIINWGEFVDTSNGNVYGRELVARGAASLHVMYGHDTQNMSRTRELVYDTSRKLGRPQTFLFSDPFLARYLRMYPRAFPGANSACLKFEILGCRFSDLANMQCLGKSSKQITESNEIHQPYNEVIGMYHNVTSSECEELCLQNVTECRSAFHPENESCFLYMINKTDLTKSYQEERDSLSAVCCLQERRSDTLRFHQGWVEHQRTYVEESGFLSSVGYPFTYPYNSIYSWKIDLPEKFATLQFMDISLREFKWKGRNDFLECTDAIYIYRTKDDTIWSPFQERYTIDSSKFYTIDSEFNGRTPVFSMESLDQLESNFITFYSCSYGDVLKTGRGFRIHVSGTDQPFCHSEEAYSYCMLSEMEIISLSFLGRPCPLLQWSNMATPYFWLIGYIYTMTVDGQLSLITLVELKDFDISCYSESYFAITVMDKITDVYCNANRPFGKLITLTRYMYVSYTPRQLQPAVDTVFPEGFRLAYKAIPKDKSFQEVVTETDGNEDNSTKHVCVRELGKCYSIHTVFSLSWIGVARMCQGKNATIVNIKTAKEMMLLRQILLEHYQLNRTPPLELHIGLMRYQDSSGVTHDHWTDGAPLTYTAWDQGEPSNTIINKCTMMRIHRPEKNNTWKTCSCLANYEPGIALAVVCETKTNSSEISSTAFPLETNFETNYVFEARDISTMYECGSGERVSRLARCNGVSECLDASDEIMCDSQDEDKCTEEEFRCTDGQCIHISKVCDFKEDCIDASDEYCEFPRCTIDQFQCLNQQCIPSEERCDSVNQCFDGSDEQECEHCHSTKAFQCGDKSCISERFVCDMHVDCPDGADERSCNHGYKTCDELWQDGYKTNGFFKTGQGYSIYCNFDNVDKGWGALEMTYPNTDWRQLDGNSFRIKTVGIENALENDYSCTQMFSAIPQREKLRVLDLDNKTFTSFEEELPLQGFPTYIVSRTFDVLREDAVFSITLHHDFDIFENRLKISGVKCRKYIPKNAGLKEPVLFCRDNVRPVPERMHCLYSRDESGIIKGCRSLEHLQHCESFICPQSYVKCPNSYCIPSMYVCNGKADCPDGHDERDCACKNSNMKLIILMPTHLSETSEQAYKWRRIAAQLGGVMYSKGSVVKILRTLNTRSISRNGTDKDNYLFESTDIVANSHYLPLDQKTTWLTAENIKDFFLGLTGSENRDNDTGIIYLSDDNMQSEEERVLCSVIDSLNRNIKTFRVVIDKYSTREVFVTYKGSLKEIHVNNYNVLGSTGAQLFPEICNESRLLCSRGYRCLYSKVCIALKQVCDKTTQCPYGDDEQFCDFKCPWNCSCAPSVINCSNINNKDWESSRIRDLSPRVLNIANSTHLCQHILSNERTRQSLSLLISLNMSRCSIDLLQNSYFSFLQNLIILDISFSRFQVLKQDVFFHLKALQTLDLSENYYLMNIEPGAFSGIKIKSLTIKNTQLKTLSAYTFKGLVLDYLDLSNNMVSSIQDLSFNSLTCSAIDISGNPVTEFTKSIFTGVKGIERLRTPAYKFCCARPSYLSEDDCLPHRDEFSSCKDLLRNSTLQALMWMIGVLALIGNIISLVYRLIYDRKRLKLGYGIFATNLALADLLMGVYMMIIAVADNIFRDKYIEMDNYWRNSAWCRLAGVLSTLSSEASVLFMCLITVDRILVIKYPFGQFRITTKTAVISVLMCWAFVFFVSLFPVIYTGYFQGQFYSKSAVCLALPLTRDRPPGWLYSILIFIGFNMFTFILIAVGQLLIYIEVRKHVRCQKFLNKIRSNDLRVARNLLFVVTTDFLCWFPVGVMGLMALAGKTVPGAVYAWTAVIVLPINSAINPFMYTLTAIYGRQKFNPSLDEQSRTDITKETGKAMLKLYPYVPTHTQRKGSKLISLADLMIEQPLTALDKIALIYRVFGFLDVLHHHDLVLENITEQEVYILVSGNRKILGKIQIDLKSYPELSSKANAKAKDLYSCGCLLRRMLQMEKLCKD